MLLSILGASLLGNILSGRRINKAGEGIIRASYGILGNILSGRGIDRAGEGIVRASYGNKNNKMYF